MRLRGVVVLWRDGLDPPSGGIPAGRAVSDNLRSGRLRLWESDSSAAICRTGRFATLPTGVWVAISLATSAGDDFDGCRTGEVNVFFYVFLCDT